jgi:hypothetical protein
MYSTIAIDKTGSQSYHVTRFFYDGHLASVEYLRQQTTKVNGSGWGSKGIKFFLTLLSYKPPLDST